MEFGDTLVFVEGGKPENPVKTLGARTRNNNKHVTRISDQAGNEPRPNWWKASAFTTAPIPAPLN